MLKLIDGMLLYHGSYTAVPEIDMNRCNAGLDFGKGFYTTTSYEQAVAFIPKSVYRNIRAEKIPADFKVNDGQVSVYRLHLNENLQVKFFQEADLDWLHFVAANRNHKLFQDVFSQWKSFDIIGGKIADDDTAKTLSSYVTGVFGIPGTKRIDNFVIESLLPNRLKDQLCFKTPEAVGTLEFVRSDRYGNIKQSDF